MVRAFGASFALIFLAQSSTPPELEVLIRARAEHASAGDLAGADRLLAELEQKRNEVGAKNVPLASAHLIHEAKMALVDRQPERAIELARAAVRLSPDLPATHAMLLRAARAGGDSGVGAMFELAACFFAGGDASRDLLANLLAYAGIGLLFTLVLFTVIQLMKYGERAGWWLPVVAVFPPALDLGVLISLGVVLAGVHAYQSRRERRATRLFLALAVLAPFALELAERFLFDPELQLARPLTGTLPSWTVALVIAVAGIVGALIKRPAKPADAPSSRLRHALLAPIPGVNHMIDDRPLKGAILSSAFAGALAAIYWLDGVVPNVYALGVDVPGPMIKVIFNANLIVLLVFISTRKMAAWR